VENGRHAGGKWITEGGQEEMWKTEGEQEEMSKMEDIQEEMWENRRCAIENVDN
jgi:hypothetical protein